MTINDVGDRVERKAIGTGYKSAYGIQAISAQSKYLYSWRFKIVKQAWFTYIGITSSKKKYINLEQKFTSDCSDPYYAFSDSGYKYALSHGIGVGYGGFESGDVVIMECDPMKKTLKFYVIKQKKTSTKELKCLFKNIKFDGNLYRMAISMGYSGAIIELIEFTKTEP